MSSYQHLCTQNAEVTTVSEVSRVSKEVNKVRQVGVGKGLLEVAHEVNCECGTTFNMVHYEEQCPKCQMVYGVTPCSSHDLNNIKPAGINY